MAGCGVTDGNVDGRHGWLHRRGGQADGWCGGTDSDMDAGPGSTESHERGGQRMAQTATWMLGQVVFTIVNDGRDG